jgi:hypothetical protein
VARTDRERLPGELDRSEILLEAIAIASLARSLGQDDALAQDRIALRLLHTLIRPAAGRSGREEAREPRPRLLDVRRRLDRLVIRLRLCDDAHQLLIASTRGKPLEVAANRVTHVVEVALLAHGRSFPADGSSPAAGDRASGRARIVAPST